MEQNNSMALTQPLFKKPKNLIKNRMIKKIIVEILKNGVEIVDEGIECFGSSSAGIKIAEICISGLGGPEKYDFRGIKNTIYDVM